MTSIPQIQENVKPKEPYQFHTERADILALADHALSQANQYRQEWLTTRDPQAWQLWQACIADRVDLLGQVGGGP